MTIIATPFIEKQNITLDLTGAPDVNAGEPLVPTRIRITYAQQEGVASPHHIEAHVTGVYRRGGVVTTLGNTAEVWAFRAPGARPAWVRDLIEEHLPAWWTGGAPAGAVNRVKSPTEPGACRWCGIPKRAHAQQWIEPVGWHTWAQPTQEQIKTRMLARRSTRTPSRTETR